VSEPNEIPPTAEVTRILASAQGGDAAARDRVFAIVYDELHGIAAGQMPREPELRRSRSGSRRVEVDVEP
jgi:hypothetical protein